MNTHKFNFNHHPKVFISYSWDSPQHQNSVLALSDRLRSEGIDCQIDQYYRQIPIPKGWYGWMMDKIEESDFILVICTNNYYLRFRGKGEDDEGYGVKWEGAIITQDIYNNGSKNYKYIPVLFNENDKNYIPEPLRSSSRYKLYEQYEDIYRHLTGQPDTPIPELGKLRALPPHERQQNFTTGKLIESIYQERPDLNPDP